MNKTIADHMVDVVNEYDTGGVMYGDCSLLDFCAERCTHTTLMDAHPMNRHIRILNAVDRSDKFIKSYISLNGVGLGDCRKFKLKAVYCTGRNDRKYV